ncbi:MAG TPA: hypothetical protein VJM11_13960 [Nevskiaceae bacterium]|nr:hypothetical protein [Nevskiaceae bacterium]
MNAAPWDPVMGLPTPPVETVYNETVAFWAATVYLCFAAPVVLYALFNARNRTGQVMLMILVGGALCATVEPFADLLGGCWHPEVGQPTVFTILGRGIPPWVCIGYFTYFGAIAAANYVLFSRGITRRMVWIAFLVPVLVDIGMENLMLSYGLYHYYGNQPLSGLGWLPLWWPPINAVGEFAGVVAVIFLAPHLKGWRFLLLPLAMPIVDLLSYGLLAYPPIVAVNMEDMPAWLTHLLGLWPWLMAMVFIHFVSYLLATDSPLRRDGRVSLPAPGVPSAA